jgi:hypothetical protein
MNPSPKYKLLAEAFAAAGLEVQADEYELIDAILAAANLVLEIRSLARS